MRSLLVAALAALACCTFYAEALSFLSRPQTPRAFVELLGSPGPSSAPEAKSDEQGYSLERSAEETEEKDTSASAGSQAEGHKASAQEQNQLAAEAQEGSANETDQEQAASDADSSSSAAEQQAVEGAADEGQQKAAAGSEQQRTSSQAAENEKHSNADSGDHQNSASSRSSSEAEPQGSEDGSANEGSNSSAAEPAAAAGHTEQQPSDRSLTAGNSDSALAVTETLNPQNRRVQSIAPHAAAEDSASGSNAQEPLRVEEITANCVLTHNKIRTARLDQWPDPLAADDKLSEAARNLAEEFVTNACALPEGRHLNPLDELMAPKNGEACEGLGYVFLDGMSEIESSKAEFPGFFSPATQTSSWYSPNAKKLALMMSDAGKSVGCAATVGCPEDVIFCKYSPNMVIGNNVFSKGLFEALKKRQRVESQSHGTPFLPSSVADHEVKAIAGAKVAQLEASAAAFSSPSVALCLLSVPILVLFHPL